LLFGALLALPLAQAALERRTWPVELAIGWTVMAYLLFAPHVSSTEDLLLLVPFGMLVPSDRLGSEARACVANGRGNGALRKLGAVQEGVLRRSFLKNGQFLDQMLWSILAEEWRQAKAVWSPGLVH